MVSSFVGNCLSLHPKPQTLNPKTLNPKPCIEAIASLDTGRAMLLLHYVADRRVGVEMLGVEGSGFGA